MAKTGFKKKGKDYAELDYGLELRRLKEGGPQRLYLLWGQEDYLRDSYLAELKKICLPEGDSDFSYKRMDGPALDADELRYAVDAMPFMTERSFIELRDIDINKLQEPERIIDVLSDIPDFATVALVLGPEYRPDSRLKLVKKLRELAVDLEFTQQSSGSLKGWVKRHFAHAGKKIDDACAERLIMISGSLMSGLLPEIEKVAAYVQGDTVTLADIEAVAHHLPESVIFDMTELIAARDRDGAIRILGELLADKTNEPVQMLGGLGYQMRCLYAARLAVEKGLGVVYLTDECGIRLDFKARKLMNQARGFSLAALRRAVELCAEADYSIKGQGLDNREVFKETVLRITAGEDHA